MGIIKNGIKKPENINGLKKETSLDVYAIRQLSSKIASLQYSSSETSWIKYLPKALQTTVLALAASLGVIAQSANVKVNIDSQKGELVFALEEVPGTTINMYGSGGKYNFTNFYKIVGNDWILLGSTQDDVNLSGKIRVKYIKNAQGKLIATYYITLSDIEQGSLYVVDNVNKVTLANGAITEPNTSTYLRKNTDGKVIVEAIYGTNADIPGSGGFYRNKLHNNVELSSHTPNPSNTAMLTGIKVKSSDLETLVPGSVPLTTTNNQPATRQTANNSDISTQILSNFAKNGDYRKQIEQLLNQSAKKVTLKNTGGKNNDIWVDVGNGKKYAEPYSMTIPEGAQYYQPTISNSTPTPVSGNDYAYTITSSIGGTVDANPIGLHIISRSDQGVETIRNTNNAKQATYTLSVDPTKLSQTFDIYARYGVHNPQGTSQNQLINKKSVTLDNRAAPVWITIPDVSLNQGQTKTINLKDYLTQFGEQTLFVTDGSLPAGVTLKDGVLAIASSALPQDKTVIKLKGYRNLSQGGKTLETATSFKLTIIEKVNTETGSVASPKVLSVTNEITLDNAWSIYDNYQLYKVNGNAVNDAPVKTGKIVLPGKIDLAGLEAGTFSLYLYNSKTGSSEGIVVIKN